MELRDKSRLTAIATLLLHYLAIGADSVAQLVLVPFYLRHIPAALFGAWLATGSVLNWLTAIDPGMTTILTYRVSKAFGGNERVELQRIISGGLLLSLLVATLGALAGLTFGWLVPRHLHLDSANNLHALQSAFLPASLGVAVSFVGYPMMSICQGLQKNVHAGAMLLASSTIGVIVTVLLVGMGWGVMGLAMGQLARAAALALLAGAQLIFGMHTHALRFEAYWEVTRELVGQLGMTWSGKILSTLSGNIEFLALAAVLGPSVVPAYSCTRKTADLFRMLANRPISAIGPLLTHSRAAGGDDQAKALLTSTAEWSFRLVALVCGALLVFNPDFVRLWVGPAMFSGRSVNGLIVAVFAASVVSVVGSSACYAMGDIGRNTGIQSAISVCLLLLAYPALHFSGLKGLLLIQCVCIAGISGAYYPAKVVFLSGMSPKERSTVLLGAAKALFAATLLALAFSHANSAGWIRLTVNAGSFCLAYLALLLVLCEDVRAQFGWARRQIASRFTAKVRFVS